MKEWLLNLVRAFFHFSNRYGDISYAQEGEDRILSRVIDCSKKGYYIDIGAHSPSRCSNTYYFYKKGWCGINIDAMPGSMNLFNITRRRDINLEIAIGDTAEDLLYYIFPERLLNTFDPIIAKERAKLYPNFKTKKIKMMRLDRVLDQYLPINQEIDFFSIDVEGFDFEVIKTNNWEKYRPKFIVVEILTSNITEVVNHPIGVYLQAQGYDWQSKT